jgi:hypothetical protein
MAIVYVFASNLEGRHGKGSALEARLKWGAIYGQGEGRQGNSYGIPTKKTPYITLPLDIIQQHVEKFIEYSKNHPEDFFNVVKIGCGLAGYSDQQIAPFFEKSPSNVNLHNDWKSYLSKLELTMDDFYIS